MMTGITGDVQTNNNDYRKLPIRTVQNNILWVQSKKASVIALNINVREITQCGHLSTEFTQGISPSPKQ